MPKSTKSTHRRSECPIAFGLDLFGDKWTLLILRDLLFYNVTRFSDFAIQEKIAPNILADRLNRLENAELITKAQDKTLRNQNIYLVTEKGKELLPVLAEMMAWGLRNDERAPVSRQFLRRLKTERKQVVNEVIHATENGTIEEYRSKEMGVDPNVYINH